jgi:hypothetical protein
MPHRGDYESMGKRRMKGKAKVSEIAEAIKRKHPGTGVESSFKMANAAVTRMKRKRR